MKELILKLRLLIIIINFLAINNLQFSGKIL
jgi:hypothetical protein